MRCQLREQGHAVLGSHLVSGVQWRPNTESLVSGAAMWARVGIHSSLHSNDALSLAFPVSR